MFNFVAKSQVQIDQHLEKVPAADIWGIGYKSAKVLSKQSIFTTKDFKYTDPAWVKANLKLIGLKTLREINNVSCLELEAVAEDKKGIASTRSFGKNVETLDELKEALANYISIASEKLRKQHSLAGNLYVFIMTSRFHKFSYYYGSQNLKLPTPTFYTPDLINMAHKMLEQIYKPGYKYKKAGIYLSNLIPENQVQTDLFIDLEHPNHRILSFKKEQASKVVDRLRSRFGAASIQLAAQGTKFLWAMNSDFRSPRYTTNWRELPKIKI